MRLQHIERLQAFVTAAVVAGCLAAQPARAITASASLDKLTFTVIDLDLDDGITPSLTINMSAGQSLVSALIFTEWENGSPRHEEQVAPGFMSTSLAANAISHGPSAYASASLGVPDSLSALGSLPSVGHLKAQSIADTSSGGGPRAIMVSPHSLLRVTGEYAVSADLESCEGAGCYTNTVFSSVEFLPTCDVCFERAEALAFADAITGPDKMNGSGVLTLDIANPGSDPLMLDLEVASRVYANAVPESSSAALLAMGLALLPILRRRASRFRTASAQSASSSVYWRGVPAARVF